jgi:hypothetical protein
MQLPFLKKKGPEVMIGKGYTPTERIREMASRGFSEPEMIDVLRREGFSPEEIDRGLTQALRSGLTGGPQAPSTIQTSLQATQPQESTELPTIEQLMPKPKEQETLQVPETSLPSDYYQYPTEDYIDTIVQARVSEVLEKISEFSVKYQELDKRVNVINEKLDELMKERGEGQQQILNRIDSFGESVSDISTRVGSLEKAFKETLPALIESVRALTDLVQRMKREV